MTQLITFDQLQSWTQGVWSSDPSVWAAELFAQRRGQTQGIRGISTDSRSLNSDQAFLALRGERFDGHGYLEQAAKAGALLAIVDQPQSHALPQLLVADTGQALLDIAKGYRAQFDLPLVSLTGSAGKTTSKEMLAMVLSAFGATHATQGNLNNEIGVPLTLLQLQPEHRFAVIEHGANHLGEIARTVAAAKPKLSILLNASDAHLGEFGSRQAIVRAKAEIYSGLAEQGMALYPLNNEGTAYWQALLAGRQAAHSFALQDPQADYYLSALELHAFGSQAIFHYPSGQIELRLQVPGEHNLLNACAVLAAAHLLGLPLAQAVNALSEYRGSAGRLQKYQFAHACLIDDSYNASPKSVAAAMDVLSLQSGTRIMVLADMAELGQESAEIHARLGGYAQGRVDQLLTLGKDSEHALMAFAGQGQHFVDRQALYQHLQSLKLPNLVVLVKGSHASGIYHLAEQLRQDWATQ